MFGQTTQSDFPFHEPGTSEIFTIGSCVAWHTQYQIKTGNIDKEDVQKVVDISANSDQAHPFLATRSIPLPKSAIIPIEWSVRTCGGG
jgi:hypothetical protein